MNKFKCTNCGYIYDPSENDNVEFMLLSDDWICPECGADKDQFKKI